MTVLDSFQGEGTVDRQGKLVCVRRNLLKIGGAFAWLAMLCAAVPAFADEIVLKNGLVLKGAATKRAGLDRVTALKNDSGPVPNISFWVVDDGVRRYFVHRLQVSSQEPEAELAGVASFQVPMERSPKSVGPSIVGGFRSVTPFDEYGRRTVVISTRKGETPIVQAISELRPDYVKVEGVTHSWEYALDTKAVPEPVLVSLISQSSNRDLQAERLVAVEFYLQAEMYQQARDELKDMMKRFPGDTARWESLERQVLEQQALRGINEIQRRRAAGQHLLAYTIARQFPADEVSAAVLRDAEDVVEEYETAMADRDRAVMLLDLLQASVPPEQAQRLATMRVALMEELHYETMPRLTPFLRAEFDDSLTAEQKLALAYSGWLLGADAATLSLREAIGLWDIRFMMLEYLRSPHDPASDAAMLERLQALEGVSVERLARMAPMLPLPFEAPPAVPGEVIEVQIPAEVDQPAVSYSLMLPPEYSPQHKYPLLVALKGPGTEFADAVRWWGGDAQHSGWAQRRGYIVIAPHYCDVNATEYGATSLEHAAVLRSIDHVRQRFRVDSDRVFLTGHGHGADACFDLGMSHGEVFAGVIPIAGIADRYCPFYKLNAPHLAWYVVGGERDRDTLEQNASVLNEMMNRRQDVIYCEYKARGFEPYHEEQARIFQWMQLHRRAPLSQSVEFEARVLRKSDNRFYWMEGRALPDRLFPPIVWNTPQRRVDRSFSGKITPGSDQSKSATIYLKHPGDRTTVWLSPEIVDFEKRYQFRVNQKVVFNEFLRPSAEALLSDLRRRGDRERLFWVRLDF